MSTFDEAVIKEGAAEAARQLREVGMAHVSVCPGDATAYRFVIVAPGHEPMFETTSPLAPSCRSDPYKRDYMVVLATSFGRAYAWSGQPVHGSYAADKWAHDHHVATGRVVAAFLNAVAEELAPLAGSGEDWTRRGG